jgi:hypothetical protein
MKPASPSLHLQVNLCIPKKNVSPLVLSLQSGSFEIVSLVLSAPGIDLNQACEEGMSPLTHAILSGGDVEEAIQLLLQRGAKVGRSLHVAAEMGKLGLMEIIATARKGAINAKDDTDGGKSNRTFSEVTQFINRAFFHQ